MHSHINNKSNCSNTTSHIFVNKKNNNVLSVLKSNNQLARIISNFIVISGIGSGAYLDITYFSYSLKNVYDRYYESLYMLILYIWAAFTYLNTSYTHCYQTNYEKITSNSSNNKGNPIFNIKHKDFSKFCELCNSKKFIRASHCSKCNHCVLRRDHHCPGLGVCVGFQNTKGFVNLLVAMFISSSRYLFNLYNFYKNISDIKIKFPFLKISLLVKVWIVLDTIFVFICNIASFMLILQQLIYIYNDLPYYDLTKKLELEFNHCISERKNEKNTQNVYNKGCIANFYYIIGNSILHFFLPIPKYNELYDIIENEKCFNSIYKLHPFQIHNYLINSDNDEFKEKWEAQVKSMDPQNFINLAEENYKDKFII